MIHVNHGTASQAHMPFGGVKDSGQGAYSIGPTAESFTPMSKPSTSGGRPAAKLKEPDLEPLSETLLGARAYRALWTAIVSGRIESGAQLRPDTIAEQLDISTTPVREALHRMEGDGLIMKLPYRGWFVREFTEQEVRELYEMRAALELQRPARLRAHQRGGTVLAARAPVGRGGGSENRRHGGIPDLQPGSACRDHGCRAQRLSFLGDGSAQSAEPGADGQDHPVGRTASRAIEEHRELIDLIAAGRTRRRRS